MASQTHNRYEFIDSIRGIATLCVVFEHVLGIIAKHIGPSGAAFADSITGTFGFGKFGVVLFFAVSGFVVPFSLRGARKTSLQNFVISRFFRLYPVYWMSVLAAALLISGELDPSPYRAEILVNLTMLQQFVGIPNVLPLYWTLQIELIFYSFCAFIFFCRQLDRPGVIFAYALFFLGSAMVLAAARYQLDLKLPVAIPLGLMMMCFGLLYRRGCLEHEAPAKFYAYWLLALFILAMPCIALLAYNKDMGFGEHWSVYTASYLAAMGAFILFTTRFKIHNPVFVWMGRISYSVYLFHPIVIFLYKEALGSALYQLPILVHFVIVSMLTLGLCHFLFEYIEVPSIALGRRIIQALSGQRREAVIGNDAKTISLKPSER